MAGTLLAQAPDLAQQPRTRLIVERRHRVDGRGGLGAVADVVERVHSAEKLAQPLLGETHLAVKDRIKAQTGLDHSVAQLVSLGRNDLIPQIRGCNPLGSRVVAQCGGRLIGHAAKDLDVAAGARERGRDSQLHQARRLVGKR
eukprot:scaffold3767_cov114-Isochrysis_galbana.AAC.35